MREAICTICLNRISFSDTLTLNRYLNMTSCPSCRENHGQYLPFPFKCVGLDAATVWDDIEKWGYDLRE